MNKKLNPKYVADFEKGNKVFIFDREKEDNFVISHEEFVKMEWIKKCGIGNIIIEGAHCRFSATSATATLRWPTVESITDWWKKCSTMNVEVRLWPESTTPTARARSELKKTGENDIKSIHNELIRRPHLWNTLQKTKNVTFHDRNITFENHVKDKTVTNSIALFEYKKRVNFNFGMAIADDTLNNNDKLKETFIHKLISNPIILQKIEHRLQNHTNIKRLTDSNSINIVNGIAEFECNGKKYQFDLLKDALEIEKDKKGRWKAHKKNHLLFVCLTIIDFDGNPYYNLYKNRLISFKEAKQYTLGSTPFHRNGGHIRARLMNFGAKSFANRISKEMGITDKLKRRAPDDEDKNGFYDPTHDEIITFGVKAFRIACEQAWKVIHEFVKSEEFEEFKKVSSVKYNSLQSFFEEAEISSEEDTVCV